MKRIIDITDEYYKIITEIPNHQCTADMLIIKNSIPCETVTEFADRCKECGAKYGKLLKQQSCDDAISRQAVLDCLTATGLKKYDYILNARSKIKALPPVIPTQRWIPVSERLPSDCDEDWVLAQIQEDNGYLWMPCVAEYRKSKDDWFSDANDIGWLRNHEGAFKVIAWMPLPEPYKEESEDDNEMSVSDKNNS